MIFKDVLYSFKAGICPPRPNILCTNNYCQQGNAAKFNQHSNVKMCQWYGDYLTTRVKPVENSMECLITCYINYTVIVYRLHMAKTLKFNHKE
jgi:hypothetical protein